MVEESSPENYETVNSRAKVRILQIARGCVALVRWRNRYTLSVRVLLQKITANASKSD